MLAIVCPGQGAQKPGFLSPWLEDPAVRPVLEPYGQACGVDLVRHGTESDADTLRDTAVAQPLLVAAALLAADSLAGGDGWAANPGAQLVAGHSVGEVGAAALAGVIGAADAMRLVGVRSRAMAEAAAAEPTSMAAVIGGVREEVLSAISEHGLHPANLNAAAQVVAAGAAERIQALVAAPPARTRVIPLQVAGAFHTPFMAPARTALDEFTATLEPADASAGVELVSNAGGEILTDGPRYLRLIVDQIAGPVDWEACMAAFARRGVTGLLELNPAGTLTGLAKRDLKGVALQTLNTPEDLEAARAFVREHGSWDPADAVSKEN